MKDSQPVVAVILGDPAGIGPELVAKLFNEAQLFEGVHTVLLGDRWLWQEGQRVLAFTINYLKSVNSVKRASTPGRYFCRRTRLPKVTLTTRKKPPLVALPCWHY